MKTVQPIRSLTQIHKIENILKSQSLRDYMLFRLGINSGLRISDILSLKAKDLRNQDYFNLKEQKTGKTQRIKIQPTLKKELNQYLLNLQDNEYLFQSQKGINKPIQRMQAWRILNDVARKVGINEEIGCHTMRKTFGYWMYKMCKDVTIVQKFLNHSSPSVTLRYIGIVQDDMDSLIDSFDFDNFGDKKVNKVNPKKKMVI
jgi:integrase